MVNSPSSFSSSPFNDPASSTFSLAPHAMQIRSGSFVNIVTIFWLRWPKKVSWRAVKDGAAVFRDIVGCELRTSVKIWESINGGEAKPYGLRPPTGPPPSPATLDKGQRWRKEPCALLALSQHKTVGFQIFRFDRRFVHFFVFALKCEGCRLMHCGALWAEW